jgi:hypothetical protein
VRSGGFELRENGMRRFNGSCVLSYFGGGLCIATLVV